MPLEAPLPSLPDAESPQHMMAPVFRTAHVWLFPASTCTALVIPVAATGVSCEPGTWPLPSCPLVPPPQHSTDPLLITAHVCDVPHDSVFCTVTGSVGEGQLVPAGDEYDPAGHMEHEVDPAAE